MEANDRNDALVHANIERFQAALTAGLSKIDGPETLDSLIIVLDGSDQDETTLAIVRELSLERSLRLVLTCGLQAGDSDAEDELVLGAQRTLEADGLHAEVLLSGSAENHERIRSIRTQHRAAWLVMPSPFGHDYADLGAKSLGTAVEVTLTESEVPTILVRGPLGDVASEPLSRPHLIVRETSPATARAARVALAMLTHRETIAGTLTVTFVYGGRPDPDVDDAVARGFGVEPQVLMPLLSHGLSGILHRLDVLSQMHLGLKLELRLVQPGGEAIDEDVEHGRLHILPRQGDRAHVDDSVQDFVLGCSDPVVVVPAVS
ncbi:MAG: hypothetical protein KDC95_15430 [Planctomycetes bacterium]|nr:hypothetical protein [Planctomycetota bacterium]